MISGRLRLPVAGAASRGRHNRESFGYLARTAKSRRIGLDGQRLSASVRLSILPGAIRTKVPSAVGVAKRVPNYAAFSVSFCVTNSPKLIGSIRVAVRESICVAIRESVCVAVINALSLSTSDAVSHYV